MSDTPTGPTAPKRPLTLGEQGAASSATRRNLGGTEEVSALLAAAGGIKPEELHTEAPAATMADLSAGVYGKAESSVAPPTAEEIGKGVRREQQIASHARPDAAAVMRATNCREQVAEYLAATYTEVRASGWGSNDKRLMLLKRALKVTESPSALAHQKGHRPFLAVGGREKGGVVAAETLTRYPPSLADPNSIGPKTAKPRAGCTVELDLGPAYAAIDVEVPPGGRSLARTFGQFKDLGGPLSILQAVKHGVGLYNIAETTAVLPQGRTGDEMRIVASSARVDGTYTGVTHSGTPQQPSLDDLLRDADDDVLISLPDSSSSGVGLLDRSMWQHNRASRSAARSLERLMGSRPGVGTELADMIKRLINQVTP